MENEKKLGIGRVEEGPNPESFSTKNEAILFANKLSNHINQQLGAGRKPEAIVDRYLQLNRLVDEFKIDTLKELNPSQPGFQMIVDDLKRKLESNSMPPPSKWDDMPKL